MAEIQPIPEVQFTDNDEETFSQLADSMPSSEQGFLDSVSPITQSEDAGVAPSPVTDATPERKVVKVSKNIKKAMNKFKKKVAEFPIAWFHQQAKGNPEWELDEEEKDLITDAIGTVFELLDIEFAIEPLSVQLTSIWWVIAYPVLTFVFLFLTKKSLTMEREQQEQQQAAQEEAMRSSAA